MHSLGANGRCSRVTVPVVAFVGSSHRSLTRVKVRRLSARTPAKISPESGCVSASSYSDLGPFHEAAS